MAVLIFFNTIQALNAYSFQLGHSIQDVYCKHCKSASQWVPHGFVYKKARGGNRDTVGKRILCSNRGRKQGCGRTLRIYLTERTPKFHYSVIAVFSFMKAILSMPIGRAYQHVTGCHSPRNAYRWLYKLSANSSRHRVRVSNTLTTPSKASSNRSKLIGETFSALLNSYNSAEGYQIQTQEAFIVS